MCVVYVPLVSHAHLFAIGVWVLTRTYVAEFLKLIYTKLKSCVHSHSIRYILCVDVFEEIYIFKQFIFKQFNFSLSA